MKNNIDLRNVPVGTKCILRNGDNAVILAFLDNPLLKSYTVVGYQQYYSGEQSPISWNTNGLWGDKEDSKCRQWDIVKIIKD